MKIIKLIIVLVFFNSFLNAEDFKREGSGFMRQRSFYMMIIGLLIIKNQTTWKDSIGNYEYLNV